MIYPTELVAKAKYELEIFERVAADTGAELVAEVVILRSLVREMRAAAKDVGGAAIMSTEIAFDELLRLSSVIEESKHSVPES